MERLEYLVAFVLEKEGDDLQNGLFIFDNQDCGLGWHCGQFVRCHVRFPEKQPAPSARWGSRQ